MNLKRIYASALHSWYHLSHAMETWIDLFWFSLIDILIYGFISLFIFKDLDQPASFLLAGVIIWEVLRIGQYTITVGMLWEIWSKSFSSLFITPLNVWEFIAGQVISGILKSIVVAVAMIIISAALFNYNILELGVLNFSIYFIIAFIFSISAGVLVMTLIFRFGTNIQSLAWGLIFLVQPVSAIFYPLEVLPQIIQPIALLSPVTHIMQSVRSQLTGGNVLWENVLIGLALAVFYLAVSLFVARGVLKRSKETGTFARMAN